MEIPDNKESVVVSGRNSRQRRKIWELEHNYHCAVIGTCLTLSETRKMVSHFYSDTADMSDYDFHTYAVHMISYNDKPGKKIQNFLDRKFKAMINDLKKMDRNELRKQWKSVLRSGDVISTFWALITHPNANPEIIKDAYGDIHMMSHLSGAGNRADIKQLKLLQSERNELRETCVMWQSRFQQESVENESIRKDLGHQFEINQQLSRDLAHAQSMIESLLAQNSEKIRQQLEHQIGKLKQQINHLKNSNEKLKEKVVDLNQQLEETICHTLNPVRDISLQVESGKTIQLTDTVDDNCNDCPFGDEDKVDGLCGRCILYVGGRTRLTPHFRQLVENKEGTFLHHDGGMEQSSQELSNLLSKADLVVFPMDCVSHKAYFQLKKACKKQDKPYMTLNSSGVSSFSSLLDGLVINQ
jgi:ElaB/YqjD/DUF883 family membrane-anchored ribosome-binding protein